MSFKNTFAVFVWSMFITLWSPFSYAATKSYELQVADKAAFDRLQRTYVINKEPRPHILFLIDRKKKTIYYANSKLFDFHYSFARSLGLNGSNAKAFFLEHYLQAERSLLLGTVGYLPKSQRYYWEFSDKNVINDALYKETYAALKATFFSPLYFKPNSLNQEQVRLKHHDIPNLTLAEFASDKTQVIYSQKIKTGILKYVDTNFELGRWDSNNIVVFDEPPTYVTPLQGIITLQQSSPLAHIHMLAMNWQVPDVYWRGVAYQRYVGKWVTLDTRKERAVLRHAHQHEIDAVMKQQAASIKLPKVDVRFSALTPLNKQRAVDSNKFGFKAANLGHVTQLTRVSVPQGYSIPFHYYAAFIKSNSLNKSITELLSAENLPETTLRSKLYRLREAIVAAPINSDVAKKLLNYHRDTFGDDAVFVRSSTNAEDAPGFSGAGLYTSVPNVIADEELLKAVKTVWSSIWNLRAYKAREKHGIKHEEVMASVLIQRAMPADAAGVLVTQNPFNQFSRNSMLINAKRGLGIKVVDGHGVPEQILYHRVRKDFVILSESMETTQLVLSDDGGVKEVELPLEELMREDFQVLSDELIPELANAAEEIEALFGGKAQDIEWLVVDGRVWIVQSRPFVY